jgi:hypothetical protein
MQLRADAEQALSPSGSSGPQVFWVSLGAQSTIRRLRGAPRLGRRTGEPVAGFPKWTGGFSLFTPAVADLDCDGRLELALVTREGYLHVLRTGGLAAAGRQA